MQLQYALAMQRVEREPAVGSRGCCLDFIIPTPIGRQSHGARAAAGPQAMLATLQKQNRGLQAEVKRHRAAAAADEALRAEASQARAALAVCILSCSTP